MRQRAIHAAYVRISRMAVAKKTGDAVRELAAGTRPVREVQLERSEIATASLACAVRRAEIRERLRTDEHFLRVSPHASREGWQALYAARLVRENPARTSYTREELMAKLMGTPRELA